MLTLVSLSDRPDRIGLPDYLSSMDRVSNALRDLKSTNLRSNRQA
jgi:exocyst complex component 7